MGNLIINRALDSIVSVDSFPARFINSSTILYGNVFGQLWNLDTNKPANLDFIGNHEYEFNPIYNTIFTFYRYHRIFDNVPYKFDLIQEYNLTGYIVWKKPLMILYHILNGAHVMI